MVLPPEETADFKALENELDPDKAIALAEAYVKKYPNSQALSYVYAFEGNAYENKGDAAKIVEYAERSIALKNDNLMSLLEAAYAIPQPQYTRLHEADAESQLDKAEAYAKDAIKAVDSLKKVPHEHDAAFANRKAGYLANAHGDLGMIHLDRAQLGLMSLDTTELAKAIDEYKLAVSLTPHPNPTDYYRMGEAYKLLGNTDEAIAAFSQASDLGQGVLKQYADQQVAALKKAKATAGPPAKP
jgi:tetratricopeptide (TPR) repeat protein